MGPAFTGSGGTGTLGRGGMYEQSTHFIHRVVSTTETRSRAQGGVGWPVGHRGDTGPLAASADWHAVLGVQTDAWPPSQGRRHIF